MAHIGICEPKSVKVEERMETTAQLTNVSAEGYDRSMNSACYRNVTLHLTQQILGL